MLAVGAIIGGIFAFYFGVTASILTDAITFAVAGMLIMRVNYDPQHGRKLAKAWGVEPSTGENTSFMEGLRYVRKTPAMAAALFVKFGLSIGNVDTLLTVFATQIFVYGASGELSQAVLWSALGFGAWIGPVLTNRVNNGSVKHMRQLISYGFVLALLCWPLLAWSSGLAVVALAIFVRACGNSVNWTYSNVIIQKTAPDAKLGRMFSIDWVGFHIAVIISSLTHGILIDQLGLERLDWIIWGTLLVSLIPLLVWFWAVRKLEQIEAHEEIVIVVPIAGG
jgi:hypothetical protein